MAMRLMSPEEFASALERRGCTKVGPGPRDTTLWRDKFGEPFSVPAPQNLHGDRQVYPDWMLDDLIREVGLPEAPAPAN